MDDRETICERVLLVVAVGVVCVCGYVGCQSAPPVSVPILPAAPTNRAAMTPPVPPTQRSVAAERLQSARTTHAVVAPGMTLTISSNGPALVRAVAPYEGRGQLSLAWDASPDPDVQGYRIYYGRESGVYSNSANVGNSLKATVTGLEEGVLYYFACVAYDATGAESVFSNEASGVTSFYVSIRPASWTIETYGRAGATNYFQRSTDLTNWVEIKQFIGVSGVLTNVIEPNQATAYYRVGVKP